MKVTTMLRSLAYLQSTSILDIELPLKLDDTSIDLISELLQSGLPYVVPVCKESATCPWKESLLFFEHGL